MANKTTLPRQTRDSFDVAAVRLMLLRGDDPPQGWVSLMDEACHRIAALENRLGNVRAELRRLGEMI